MKKKGIRANNNGQEVFIKFANPIVGKDLATVVAKAIGTAFLIMDIANSRNNHKVVTEDTTFEIIPPKQLNNDNRNGKH